jgi:hypothetical protein
MTPHVPAKLGAKGTLLILCLALLAPRAFAQAATLEDARFDYARGDYRAALQKTNKLLSTSLAPPTAADKYEILTLRGECQLQLKDRMGAVTSFKSAVKCAADVNQFATARANAVIIERSSMGRYIPAYGVGKEPIDVVAPDTRRQAMAALRDELWSKNQRQIETALKATTLPPIEKAFVPLADMYCLELAATGQTNETGQLMRDLGQQTYRLMRDDITRYARQIEQLSLTANSSGGGNNGRWDDGPRGLFSTERNDLKNSVSYLVKLRDRATEYRTAASKLGGNEQRWDGLVVDITDTLAVAQALLNDQ